MEQFDNGGCRIALQRVVDRLGIAAGFHILPVFVGELDEVQIVPRFQPGPDLQLPGGGIDPGESPITALHREVYEETGWHVANPRRVGAFRRFTYMPEYDLWAEKLCLIYMASPVRRDGPPLEPGHTALWMRVDEAMSCLANSGDRDFVARFQSRIGIFQQRR